MNTHLISPLLLALSLGLSPLLAQAPPTAGPLGQGQRSGQKAERMAQHLQLSDDQRAKIKGIREKHQVAMKGHREATQQARKAFFEASKNPDTPLDQLRKLHQAMSDQAFELMATRRAMRLETRQVLTSEQREKAAEVQGRMGERMRARREGHRGRNGQP